MTEATKRIIDVIRSIPPGKVMSYGAVAAAAGQPNGARQVARILHAMSDSQDLPWYRVVKRDGRIAFPTGPAFDLQKSLLEAEGVVVKDGAVDLKCPAS